MNLRTTLTKLTGADRRALWAGVAALALTGSALAAASPSAAADEADKKVVKSRGISIDPFYNPPASLPSRNGAIVRHEPLELAVGLSLPRGGALPAKATRVMYKTTDKSLEPAAVTGAFLAPTAKWHGKGERPLVVLAPGTLGQGDQCAASRGLQYPITLNGKTVAVGYEDIAIYHLLLHGVAVMVTDYVGLGATDRLHTYVGRVDEGHAVLDAARAAARLPGSGVTQKTRVGLFGYSEGGGATASAAELQHLYAKDVNLVGSYVGAPPANLIATAKGIDGSALAGALGWTVNGMMQSYPHTRPIVEKHLSDKGRDTLEDLSTACVVDGIAQHAFQKSSSLTTDGKTMNEIVDEEPFLRRVLERQTLGRRTPTGPVRVATAIHDDIVPHKQARNLAVRWCGRGVNVTYHPVMLPNTGDKLLVNHLGPLAADQIPAVAWLTQRLNGVKARSGCSELPEQP